MRTQDLIDTLAADLKPQKPFAAALAPALALGFAVSAALFLTMLGPRPDFVAALESARFLAKPTVALLLAAAALGLAARLARPGAPASGWGLALLAAPVAAILFSAVELSVLPASLWSAAWIGQNAVFCLVAIPVLAMPTLAGLIYALRRGAPLRPRLAGAVAGLASAGLAASLYATYCPDDSPLFVATWYTGAALITAGVGALAGKRWLRW
ncbi:DUF1109 domain-containing protein [Salinarimonas sp.]|uniref:DUF1109 domain-containing protein n=1 Tax=Salinarimonas sp. TaxID=2766526 RepID=UPI0032D9A83F